MRSEIEELMKQYPDSELKIVDGRLLLIIDFGEAIIPSGTGDFVIAQEE